MSSLKTTARIGGILYLIIIAAGIFGETVVRGKLIVSGDATATATNIVNSELLWRIGIAGDLIMHVCDIPLMLILYILLKPVNKNLALLFVLFNAMQSAVLIANKLSLLQSLFLLSSAEYLKAFDPAQLHALSYLAVKSHGYGFGVGLIFFGFECLIIGYLIFRSGYFPKALGVMMPIAGICYLVNSFSLILAPAVAGTLFPIILIPAFIAELSLCLWLLIKGVNVPVWERVSALQRSVP
jgi:hypothetical protein